MTCPFCQEPVEEAEGMPEILVQVMVENLGPKATFTHRECMIRQVVGSAAHQLRECPCYGGTREDPEGLSPREAAKLAYQTYLTLLGIPLTDAPGSV